MLDFLDIKEKPIKGGVTEIYPAFKVKRSKDLMVKGGAFYGIWDKEKNLWSTDAYDAQRLIDADLYSYVDEHWTNSRQGSYTLKILGDASTGAWEAFNRYIASLPDSWHQLDANVTFTNTEVTRDMYVSKRLKYPIEPGDMSAYDELMNTLYLPEERTKLEWAVGSIISGDSKKIQKFVVLYGAAGAGKSTVLNIIQWIFDGYYSGFDAKSLTSNNDAFSTEILKNNPLIAIQHDGDLSRIEDNTRINSIVSHEPIIINEKRKNRYEIKPNTFLLMATNQPVKITDSKSGIIRRLIDVSPTGEKIPVRRYNQLMKDVKFELGAIAQHCLDLYSELGPNYYDTYVPVRMMFKTDIFFNFLEEYYGMLKKRNWISLKDAYGLYKVYCDDTLVQNKLPMYKFREELKDYFDEFYETTRIDGSQVRSVYMGFRSQKFVKNDISKPEENPEPEQVVEEESWLQLTKTTSLLDGYLAECPAQYASRSEKPIKAWADVDTKLIDINTSRVHYVKVPSNMVVIDFDLKDENGEKSKEKNLEAASKWPPTYAEFSKSGSGVHLHYIYNGDINDLHCLYSEGIEVKVFKGNASLRRKLSKCNDIPIKEISSGLPLKGAKKMDFEVLKNEKALRRLIVNNLLKKYMGATKPSIDFIYKLLEDAYASGMKYDVSNMYDDILTFAMNSTHNADYCVNKVAKMHFMSDDTDDIPQEMTDDKPIVFYDVEVYPNLFVVCWKIKGEKKCHSKINPNQADISNLVSNYRLVGFNNRRYDNHILYGRMIGYTNYQLFELSQKIIGGNKNNPAFFREAYGLSYTDIYDFADASHKQSLKKFEIELGIHHQEMNIPWDEPVPEELWDKVVEYCINDVNATEAVFDYLKADWTARQILAELSGLTVNDTTNMHTTKIIFGSATKDEVKAELVYTDLSKQFPGYSFDHGKSTYRGEETGEGGYVYAEPGMYTNVALLDVASMHPTSIEELNMFGKYTKNFSDLKTARIYIKHNEFNKAKKLFNGKLAKYLSDEQSAKELSLALKTAINSVYGLTSARFDHLFKDPRNMDNIVAKRGALFMINLKHEVQERGFTVAHIKTDSIKIPNATPDIIKFVMDYGKEYGYSFEHEATYEKMCLVNNAVYIAKERGGKWTATGAQFAQSYVFKVLFSHEPLIFSDVCETKSVKDALYLDMNEKLGEDEHNYVFVGKVGSFCPIQSGMGGGELVVKRNDKYVSATGAKGYRWLESEEVKKLSGNNSSSISNMIDLSYYDKLVDDAVDNLNKYGDVEWFLSDDPIAEEELPPWYPPCGDAKIDICSDCPNFNSETKTCNNGYNLEGFIIERSN